MSNDIASALASLGQQLLALAKQAAPAAIADVGTAADAAVGAIPDVGPVAAVVAEPVIDAIEALLLNLIGGTTPVAAGAKAAAQTRAAAASAPATVDAKTATAHIAALAAAVKSSPQLGQVYSNALGAAKAQLNGTGSAAQS